MDEYLENFLSSLSSEDANALERISWDFDRSNGLLTDPLTEFEIEEKKAPLSTIASSFFHSGQTDGKVENMYDYNAGNGYQGLSTTRASLNPETYDLASFSVPNGTEPPTLSQVLPTYDNVYSLSNIMEADEMQQHYASQVDKIENDDANRYLDMNQILQLDDLSAAITTKVSSPIRLGPVMGSKNCNTLKQPPQNPNHSMFICDMNQEKHDVQNNSMPYYLSESLVTGETRGLTSFPQMTTSSPAGGCNNGPVKPRVRARRGQATDPHSIAERLRREKITERMKNLQELIPNSSKTDKASMLDEIIEYVKNLQLQVKVASSDLSSLSPSATEVAEFSPSADQIALEQEVVKLMESNVSTAMQFLQTKGLCPMPLPLANAISAAKTSSSTSNQSLFGSGLHNHNNSSSSSNSNISGVGPDQISSDSNMLTGKLNQGFVADGCDHTSGCTARTRHPNLNHNGM